MKGEIDLHKHFLFVTDKIHSWILPGQLNIDLYSSSLYVDHLSVSLARESLWKILCIIKCHSGRSRTHLAVSTERIKFQTNKSCLCTSSSSSFTVGLYGSSYDYKALTATSPRHKSLASNLLLIGLIVSTAHQ